MLPNDDPRDLGRGPATSPIEGGGRGLTPHDGGAVAGSTAAPHAEPAGVPPEDLAGVSGPPVTGTRTSHTWVALTAGLFFLVVMLVFILQNLHSVRVHFFWAVWSIPLAVDLLLAAVLGALIMFTVGSLRIVQLRRAAKRGRQT